MKKNKTNYVSVGGQALMEGIMMNGPKGRAIALRLPDGSIEVSEKKFTPLKEKYKIFGKLDGNIDKKIRINNAYLTSLVDEIYKLTIKNYI